MLDRLVLIFGFLDLKCLGPERAITTAPLASRFVSPTLCARFCDNHICTQMAIKRAIAFAPHSDMVWLETKTPDLEEAKSFARRIREHHPGK